MAILKHVGTADWDGERLNMSVNTPIIVSKYFLNKVSISKVRASNTEKRKMQVLVHEGDGWRGC